MTSLKVTFRLKPFSAFRALRRVTSNVIRFQQPLCGRQLIFLVRKTVAETEIRNAKKRCRVKDTKESKKKKKQTKKQNLFLSVRKCKPERGG